MLALPQYASTALKYAGTALQYVGTAPVPYVQNPIKYDFEHFSQVQKKHIQIFQICKLAILKI